MVVGDTREFASESVTLSMKPSLEHLKGSPSYIPNLWFCSTHYCSRLVKTIFIATYHFQVKIVVKQEKDRVSMRAYYAYLIRDGVENTITKGGRLYQQFSVDAFVSVEEDQLDYIRANQNDLRINS